MKINLIYCIVLITIVSCGSPKTYEGSYKNKKIAIQFANSKKGKIIVDDTTIIPFAYRIEKLKTGAKNNIENKHLVNYYIYRFTIDANYQLSFPLGFYEINQKRRDTLHGSDYNLISIKPKE